MTPLDEVAVYGWYAERYHWTPSMVDAQPAWVIDRLPLYARAWDEVTAELQEEANERARRESR